MFAVPGQGIAREVESMPGVYQLSVDKIVEEAKVAYDLGIPAVLIFGIPEAKDAMGSNAWHDCGTAQRAIAAIKEVVPDLIVIADTCLCEYTSHGHCGYLEIGDLTGYILNDPTLELLKKIAVSQVKAGADVVAPAGMMDGSVQAIRAALDESGYQDTAIFSYSAKYDSSYYGPFIAATESAAQFGDRQTYKMDSANAREALKEVALDNAEGADVLIVKPALAYEAEGSVKTESIAPAVFEAPLSSRPVFVNNVLQFLMIEAGVDFDADAEFAGKQIAKDDDLIHTIVRLEDGSKIPDDVVSEIDEVTNQFTRLVTWEKQDILLIDNTRALHGRRAFSCDREIYIRMGMSIDW